MRTLMKSILPAMAAVFLSGLLGQSVITAEDVPANLIENGSFEKDPVGKLSSKLPETCSPKKLKHGMDK